MATEKLDKFDVLILDSVSKIALTSARSLARAGLRVALGEAEGAYEPGHEPPAWRSRYCAQTLKLTDYTRDPAKFVDEVVAFVRAHGVRLVLPSGDATIAILAPNRQRFTELGCAIHVAPDDALEIATDKMRTLEVAAKLGIEYPKSVTVRGVEDLRAAEAQFGYPFVVKPSISWTGQVAERVHPTEVINEEEAVKATDSYLLTGCEVIAQQLASGDRISISFFIDKGEVLAYAACTALRTTPPLGGVSVQRVSIPLSDELLKASENLVLTVGLEGAVEVEYRCDAKGNPLLMEINPRLAGTLENAMHTGVNFPLMIWQQAIGEKIKPVRSYPVGVRTRWVSGDLRWMWDSMFQYGRPDTVSPARSIWTFTSEFFRTRYYDYWDLRDLRPGFVEARDTLRVIGKQWANRKKWRESGGSAIYISESNEASKAEGNTAESSE
jgi:predicted ATP-grasp superfamily ATP-dependent carboligase